MYFLKSLFVAAFSTLIPVLPAFLLLHWVYFRKWKQTACALLLGLYFAGLYFVTGLPTIQFTVFEPEFYLLPFIGILFDLRNSILNVIAFLPLGFLVPIFFDKFRSFRGALVLGLVCSLFLELAQMFTYRLSDINDLITNTLGAVLGYRLAEPLLKKFPAPVLNGKDLAITTAVTLIIMYFLRPLLGSWLWTLT